MAIKAEPLREEAEALCETARWCAARGWVPATSGNFSVRDAHAGQFLISRSGLDKGQMTVADLLVLDVAGHVVRGPASSEIAKPSAETALHVVIYRDRPEAKAILHVHTIWNTLIGTRFAGSGQFRITGYELLKALDGVATHEHREVVPVLANSQEYGGLSVKLAEALKENAGAHGVLLSGHGLYTWGKSVEDARRHLEALEFLFEVEGRRIFGS
ncbi:methylthioribulose 1-phosphate dehydratase [Terracidiphilus gabretensis]|jgi:methylthioribulose-1-phosphate dehydratase|uniref:methylthioribulose 1-phosphate dehydratase n=1 Tax=Terracidiphilus gabretensis TaxID=1577687 RepID=UPI00071C013B|nr:methylthioribulose 1-phosphate dehydratase [Terracidiphilus gabretensis]